MNEHDPDRATSDVPSKAGLTRRTFLKLSAFAAGALAVALAGGKAIADGLGRWNIPVPWYRGGEVTTTINYCDMCPWRCGIIVHTVDGVVRKIEGNPNDPKSRGKLCARGQAGVSFLYDPDRLKTPLIRTGERGDGQLREERGKRLSTT